ncbi:hypothetical protein GCM10027360_24190 [Amycolatopsis echigonensis]
MSTLQNRGRARSSHGLLVVGGGAGLDVEQGARLPQFGGDRGAARRRVVADESGDADRAVVPGQRAAGSPPLMSDVGSRSCCPAAGQGETGGDAFLPQAWPILDGIVLRRGSRRGIMREVPGLAQPSCAA